MATGDLPIHHCPLLDVGDLVVHQEIVEPDTTNVIFLNARRKPSGDSRPQERETR